MSTAHMVARVEGLIILGLFVVIAVLMYKLSGARQEVDWLKFHFEHPDVSAHDYVIAKVEREDAIYQERIRRAKLTRAERKAEDASRREEKIKRVTEGRKATPDS